MVGRKIRAGWPLLAVLLASTPTLAEVSASIDRARVESNETFTLELTVDSHTDASPDLSVLDEDFEIGQTRRLSDTRILNGDVVRSMTWTIVLSPKRSGTLTVPPISVGSEQSEAIEVSVVEPTYEPPGEADVFITAEIDQDETWVQAQVLYTIRIFRAVVTRQPALREPTFSGAEVLVEPASDERNYQELLGGRAYNVVEYVFAIFPQESGEISISPARFEARVIRDGRITGRKTFTSEPQTIKVNPIPAPPADFANAAWLPARDVALEEEWSRDPGEIRAGEPITRNVTLSALGQIQTQLPVIEPPAVSGINVYPDKPVLDRELELEGIRGTRTEQYAMIGTNGGPVSLPAVEVPWFDIDDREWRVARLPERQLDVIAAPVAPVADRALQAELPVADDAPVESTAPATTEVVHSDFWRRVAEILAFVWVLTIAAWWWSGRPRREDREPAPLPLHKQQARFLKAARKSALEEDAAGVRHALLEWAALQWPDNTPRSIGEFARRVSDPLSAELSKLSRASYGTGDIRWDPNAMAKAIRSFAVIDEKASIARGEPLPPLMPG